MLGILTLALDFGSVCFCFFWQSSPCLLAGVCTGDRARVLSGGFGFFVASCCDGIGSSMGGV